VIQVLTHEQELSRSGIEMVCSMSGPRLLASVLTPVYFHCVRYAILLYTDTRRPQWSQQSRVRGGHCISATHEQPAVAHDFAHILSVHGVVVHVAVGSRV
jgi:hypothetical protein